jgi:predicted NBD/HSP70 family sugar kinase
VRYNSRVDDNTIRDILRRADDLDYAPFAVGIAILPFKLVGVVTDLDGTKRGFCHRYLAHMDVEYVVAGVAEMTRYLVNRSVGFELPHPRVRVGLQIGGPVDPATGVVRLYRNHQIEAVGGDPEDNWEWRDVPLADLVQKATGCPTVVDNDAHAFAAYELKFGTDVGSSSFLLILLNDGVGAGVVLDHKLLSAPIEFGHIRVADSGRECECRNIGCIDALAGRRAITALVRRRTGRVSVTAIEQAVEVADRGGQEADEALPVFWHAGDSIARGAATMLTLFGPSHVVLYGPDVLIGEHPESSAANRFLRGLANFREYAYPIVRTCELVRRPMPSQPDTDRGAHGAALIALHRYFYAPLG